LNRKRVILLSAGLALSVALALSALYLWKSGRAAGVLTREELQRLQFVRWRRERQPEEADE